MDAKDFKVQTSQTQGHRSTTHPLPKSKQVIQKRQRELEVMQGELKSMKKGGRVYKQQPNSHIFFRQGVEQALSEARKEMDDLIQDYKDAEKSSNEEVKGEGREDG